MPDLTGNSVECRLLWVSEAEPPDPLAGCRLVAISVAGSSAVPRMLKPSGEIVDGPAAAYIAAAFQCGAIQGRRAGLIDAAASCLGVPREAILCDPWVVFRRVGEIFDLVPELAEANDRGPEFVSAATNLLRSSVGAARAVTRPGVRS